MEDTFQARVRELKQRMRGRWTEFLRACGIDETILSGRNRPCPMCGGRDRFQYTDKFEMGNFHCRGCGPGNGFALLQGVLGMTFGESIAQIDQYLGRSPAPSAPARATATLARMRVLAQRLWDEAQPLARGDAVDSYLRHRGLHLSDFPSALRCHPRLGYYAKEVGKERSSLVGHYPAMLGMVRACDGSIITLHRTYLCDGRKAPVPDAKKLLSAGISGAAVQLFAPGDELALAEGIETALAVHLATGKPVWSAINAGNLERLVLPTTVRRVCIYADNDASSKYDGQAAAYGLARRLRQEDPKRQVDVYTPRRLGQDWADVWARLRMRRPSSPAPRAGPLCSRPPPLSPLRSRCVRPRAS
jgi:putative DNA primase/helicase